MSSGRNFSLGFLHQHFFPSVCPLPLTFCSGNLLDQCWKFSSLIRQSSPFQPNSIWNFLFDPAFYFPVPAPTFLARGPFPQCDWSQLSQENHLTQLIPVTAGNRPFTSNFLELVSLSSRNKEILAGQNFRLRCIVKWRCQGRRTFGERIHVSSILLRVLVSIWGHISAP